VLISAEVPHCWGRMPRPDPAPHGRMLLTLKDAADYIIALPKRQHDAPEWQTAMRVGAQQPHCVLEYLPDAVSVHFLLVGQL
jgi:hypothetical protein